MAILAVRVEVHRCRQGPIVSPHTAVVEEPAGLFLDPQVVKVARRLSLPVPEDHHRVGLAFSRREHLSRQVHPAEE